VRGLSKLVWVETKIFVREPMGVVGTVGVPVLLFVLLGRYFGDRGEASAGVLQWTAIGLPILVTMLIAISAVLSLIAIISIYREGGILKRLRATPLQPLTILSAHVIVKLLFTALTLGLLVLAGRSFYRVETGVNPLSFGLAVLLSTLSVLSIGFVVSSVIPTARFAQPVASVIFYPMLALSGALFPLDMLSPTTARLAHLLPLTHAVALLEGIWSGGVWSAHYVNVGSLVLNMLVCSVLAAKIFRWE
jgi:ABC-2 type transport system permease protein